MRKAGILLLGGSLILALAGCNVKHNEVITEGGSSNDEQDATTVIDVLYSDEKYKEYFEYCEQAFEKANSSVNIRLNYAEESGEYLQNIINGSYSDDTTTDVYMLTDSELGTAYLAGVAAKNPYGDFSEDNYCATALLSCSYKDNLIAYPLSYDTAFLVYNKDFLGNDDINTFEDMKIFAENADYSSEGLSIIESIFRCDLNDIFINYGFVGAGFNLGGDTGSDSSLVEISTGVSIKSAHDYISLIEYFSISAEETYEESLEKFISGKYLSTIASTESLDMLTGEDISYGMGAFPDYNSIDNSSPLAITHCLVVNPNTDGIEIASDFARFATYEASVLLYEKAGELSARKNISYENEELGNIYLSYEKASGKNKFRYGEQVYPHIEIAMHNIVAGNSAKDEFDKIEEYMEKQLN